MGPISSMSRKGSTWSMPSVGTGRRTMKPPPSRWRWAVTMRVASRRVMRKTSLWDFDAKGRSRVRFTLLPDEGTLGAVDDPRQRQKELAADEAVALVQSGMVVG